MRQSYQQDYGNDEDAFLRRGIRKDNQREQHNYDNQHPYHNPSMRQFAFQNDPSRHISGRQGRTSKEELLHKSRSGVFLNRNFYRMDKRFYNEEEVIENYASNGDNNTSQILSDIFSKIAQEQSVAMEMEEKNKYLQQRSAKQNNPICIESPSSSPQRSPRRATQYQNFNPLFYGKDNRSERSLPREREQETDNQISETSPKNTQIRFIPQQHDKSIHRQAPKTGIQSPSWEMDQEPLPFIPLPSFQPIMPVIQSSVKIVPEPAKQIEEQKIRPPPPPPPVIQQAEIEEKRTQIKIKKPIKRSYFKERQLFYTKILTTSEKQLMQELTQIRSTPNNSTYSV